MPNTYYTINRKKIAGYYALKMGIETVLTPLRFMKPDK